MNDRARRDLQMLLSVTNRLTASLIAGDESELAGRLDAVKFWAEEAIEDLKPVALAVVK